MDIFYNAMTQVQHRVGKMPDTLLEELSLSPQTQDVFCKTSFDYTSNTGHALGIDSNRVFHHDYTTPEIVYSTLLARHITCESLLKTIAHEGGHYLNAIEQDVLRPEYVMPVAATAFAGTWASQYVVGLFDRVFRKDTYTRRYFLEDIANLGALASLGSMLVSKAGSYFEESHADLLSDAIVPETGIGPALQEIRKIFHENRNDPDAPSYISKDLPSIIASSLFSEHPDDDVRAARSVANCRKFAKNSRLWEPQTKKGTLVLSP